MRQYTRIHFDDPDRLFFTADPHFFHENIIRLCERPFRDGDEMTEALIRNWNAVVQPDGNVIVLGDMFWKRGNEEKCLKVMDRLHGKKWLVGGNHDLFPKDFYLEIGFEDARDYLEVSANHQVAVCSHYPILEWNGFYHGYWHLHGHVHGRGSHFSFRVMDVGVDPNGYMPVSWRKIEKELSEDAKLDEEAMRERECGKRHQPYKF